MYHSNNPNVIEIPDDIDQVESMTFSPGENNRVTVTFILKDSKIFINPSMLFATNGVESRMLVPMMTPAERVADVSLQATQASQIELQRQEDEVKVDTHKKVRGKKANDEGGDA